MITISMVLQCSAFSILELNMILLPSASFLLADYCSYFPELPWDTMQRHLPYVHPSLKIRGYSPISINSAGPVTHYTPAEILVLALWPGHRYTAQNIQQVTTRGPKNWGIWRGTRQSIQDLPKLTVTSVTFRQFERPCYAILPN